MRWGTIWSKLPIYESHHINMMTFYLPPIDVWMFKIQFVKGKPLKYNTIFVSLFGFFFNLQEA